MIMFIIPCFQGCVKPEMPGADGGENIYYLRYPKQHRRFCVQCRKHAESLAIFPESGYNKSIHCSFVEI